MDDESGGRGDGGRSDPDRSWSPGSAVEGAPARLQPVMQVLARALDPDLAPDTDTDAEGTDATRAAGFDIDDIGEALALLRSGLLRSGEAGDPATRGLQSRRHADLDAATLEAASMILEREAYRHRLFLQDISHDLRSPLNSVLFIADALHSRHSGPLNPVQARQIEVLFMATVTLVKMVNDVIDLARLGRGSPMASTKLPFSVETVLSDVRKLVGPQVTHNGVDLRVELAAGGLRVGDSQVLNRIMLNLISNAVHALPEGGTVDVRVTDRPEGDLEIVVEDDGQGAPIEKIRNVLHADDPYRLAGETRGWTHGLGLSISARLARASGGSIEVESAPAGGALFTVRLPFPPL